MEEKIKELTLMLLYLTSWQESEFDEKYNRSWKGYNFNALNELSEDDFIVDNKRAKSIIFTDGGIKKAEELLCKYDIETNSEGKL